MIKKRFIFISLLLFIISSFLVAAEEFNVEIEIPETYRDTKPGTDVFFTVNIVNFGNTDRLDVVMKSEILDSSNSVVDSKTKTVAVETSASFVNDLQIPEDVASGKYSLVVSVETLDGTISSTEEFHVSTGNNEYNNLIFISGGVFLVVVALIIILRASKGNIEKAKMRRKIKSIIKKKLK